MLEAKRDASARSMDGHQANGVELTAQDKPRGFFSFLTWPFYLAQAVAAEAVVGGMLRPVLADEENAAKARPTPTSENDYGTALREPGTASGAEDVGSDARADVRATETDAGAAPTSSSPNELEAGPSSGVGQGGGNVSSGAAGASGSGAASSANALSANATHQGGGEAHPASEVVAGDAITFLPDVIGGMHETAAPIFEGVIPVLPATTYAATNVVVQVFDTAEVIIEAVPGALSAPANTVTDLIGVLESAPLVEGVSPIITAAQGFSAEFVGDALGSAESLLGMATPLAIGEHESRAETTSASVTAVTDFISDEIGGGLPLEGLGGVLGSGGIITFEGAARELSADDLFAEGRHTDYGLSLRTETVTEPISDVVDRALQSDDALASAADQNTDGGQDAGLFNPAKTSDPAATSLVADVTGTFEDIGLRGSDSLF